ncbi:MAG TPA: thiamine pyrophosphate-dependent enzyme [Xanthobacteraceae bacterium]|nr:thiamine pyrophosphate-dependent enzyme [Xanthobacteraceae bacterium]
MTKRVANVLIETLQAAGVKRCYGIVGDTVNHIAHAINQSEIEWVHMRHEEAGGFAAGAEGQFTGELVACAGSCGPGSLHFINGLYEANRNRAPVVLIATQIIRQDIGFSSIQEVDLHQVYGECSVFCETILTPEHARRKTVAACQAALTKRGVAVLVVPADISAAAAHDERPYTVHARRPVIRPSDTDLDEMAAILNDSDAITIYAGAGCAAAHDEVVAIAAQLKAPVAHTSRGKDFVAYDNPYNVGMTGMIGGAAGYHAILDCDVLLQLGADFAWPQFYPDRAKIIQIDLDPTHIGRRHPVALGVVGNIKETLQALLPRLKEQKDGSFLATHVKRYHKDQKSAAAETVSPRSTIPGSYLAKTINKYAARDALFTADDGTALVWALRHIETFGTRRVFSSLLHGTMASAMPSSIGLQKCQPGRQVVCLAGDGGFAMLLGESLTIAQHKLPIKIAVFNNGKLGFIDIEQKAAGLIPMFTNLENPDFGELAKAVGFWGQSVVKAGDLDESVKTWLAQPGPALLDVKVNPMQLVSPPSPFVAPEAVVGMGVYTARAMLHGKAGDVWEMVKENV